MKYKYICIDFDNTIIKYNQDIFEPVPGAFKSILELKNKGYKLILYTLRSRKKINIILKYLKDNGIIFDAVNYNAEQSKWTDSIKIYADYYIDDKAIGCPLIYKDNNKYVDWKQVMRIINEEESR